MSTKLQFTGKISTQAIMDAMKAHPSEDVFTLGDTTIEVKRGMIKATLNSAAYRYNLKAGLVVPSTSGNGTSGTSKPRASKIAGSVEFNLDKATATVSMTLDGKILPVASLKFAGDFPEVSGQIRDVTSGTFTRLVSDVWGVLKSLPETVKGVPVETGFYFEGFKSPAGDLETAKKEIAIQIIQTGDAKLIAKIGDVYTKTAPLPGGVRAAFLDKYQPKPAPVTQPPANPPTTDQPKADALISNLSGDSK